MPSVINTRITGHKSFLLNGICCLVSLLLLTTSTAYSLNPDAGDYEWYRLTGPDSSYLMADGCDSPEVTCYFHYNCSRPGVLFDTVGIDSAQPGDWTLDLNADGILQFQLYMPGVSTRNGDGTGWHRYRLQDRLDFNREYAVYLEIHDYELFLYVADSSGFSTQVTAQLPTSLRSTLVYAGDYPGDDHWGTAYRIHRAAIGDLMVYYFGPAIPSRSTKNLPDSWLIRGSGEGHLDTSTGGGTDDGVLVTTDTDTADWDETGGAAIDQNDDLLPTNPPGQTGGGSAGGGDGHIYPPAQTPEDAVRAFLHAQADEDIDRAFNYVSMDRFPAQNQQAAREIFRITADKTKLHNQRIQVLGTAYGRQGGSAMVRVRTTAQLELNSEIIDVDSGSIVMLMKTGSEWKILAFLVDDLLNVEIDYQRGVIARPRTGLILASMQAEPPGKSNLVTLAQLSKTLTSKFDGAVYDEDKFRVDMVFSLAGQLPGLGDGVSAGYTAMQMTYTLFAELVPAIAKGDYEMIGMNIAELKMGGLQILAEPVPGFDHLVDSWGITVDQMKYRLQMARAYSRLRAELYLMDINTPEKYLFLRHQDVFLDVDHGYQADSEKHLSIEAYIDDAIEPRPIKKLVLNSDTPLRFWKTMDFDIGFIYTIRRNENEIMYDNAVAAGFVSHLTTDLGWVDYVVYIPMRYYTTNDRGPLVEGEFLQAQLTGNQPMDGTPTVSSSGTAILSDAKITGAAKDRYLQFKINHNPGPNQVLQVLINKGTNSLTLPVEIENAIFNAVEGVLVQEVKPRPSEPGKQAEVPRGELLSFKIFGDTRDAGLIPPEIQDLYEIECQSRDMDIADADMTGSFPATLLAIEGLLNGNTEVECRFMSANKHGPNPIQDSFDVEVGDSDLWKLVDVVIEPTPDSRGEFKCADGTAAGSTGFDIFDAQGNTLDISVAGDASWEPPPQSFADSGAKWHFKGFITNSSGYPATMPEDQMHRIRQYPSNMTFYLQRHSHQEVPYWNADLDTQRVRIDEMINLDLVCEPEFNTNNEYTNRRVINLFVSLPGGSANVRYIYKGPGE